MENLSNTFNQDQKFESITFLNVSSKTADTVISCLNHFGFPVSPADLTHPKSPSYFVLIDDFELRLTFHPGSCSYISGLGLHDYFDSLVIFWDGVEYCLTFKDGNEHVLTI